MAMAATRSSCSSPCAPAIAPGGVAMLLLLMLSGRAADAQAPNTCYTSTACLPEGAIACSTTSDCATGCTAGAAYAICTVEIGIAIDGQAFCLEGLAPALPSCLFRSRALGLGRLGNRCSSPCSFRS